MALVEAAVCSCLECQFDDHMHCHHERCCFCNCTHKPKSGEHGFEPNGEATSDSTTDG